MLYKPLFPVIPHLSFISSNYSVIKRALMFSFVDCLFRIGALEYSQVCKHQNFQNYTTELRKLHNYQSISEEAVGLANTTETTTLSYSYLAGETMELPYGCGALHGCRANGFIAENGEPTRPLIPAKTKDNS